MQHPPININIHNNKNNGGRGDDQPTVDISAGVPLVGRITARNVLKGTSVFICIAVIAVVIVAVVVFFIVRELKK